ncbi:MAG: serine hydrolase [Candidatus Levybacteria bacterium]|nr:serine hydrolase [Candidatus Levybacteria bacterium]
MNKKLLAFILFLSIGVNLALVCLYFTTEKHFQKNIEFEKLQEKYPLLSKRVLQELPVDILINFLDLRSELRADVAPYGDSFGFYFEYLPTGTSLGVNEKQEFHAASLFKVPVIMAYYKQRERMHMTNDPEMEIKEEHLDNEFGTLYQKGAGHKIKMSEAIRLSLEESDNTAAKMIASGVQEADFNEVYNGVDIDLLADHNGAILTPKNYSSILKALYFSAVLGKESSSEILSYLANSKFNDKLVAGIPPDITVAHKIGDFIDKETGEKAYMDCGIVYLPRRPYVLCMVSEGDEIIARQRMSNLSKKIYEYISKVE